MNTSRSKFLDILESVHVLNISEAAEYLNNLFACLLKAMHDHCSDQQSFWCNLYLSGTFSHATKQVSSQHAQTIFLNFYKPWYLRTVSRWHGEAGEVTVQGRRANVSPESVCCKVHIKGMEDVVSVR